MRFVLDSQQQVCGHYQHAPSRVSRRFLSLPFFTALFVTSPHQGACFFYFSCCRRLIPGQSGKISIIALLAWMAVLSLIRGVNSLAWAGNFDVKLKVWCDISESILYSSSSCDTDHLQLRR